MDKIYLGTKYGEPCCVPEKIKDEPTEYFPSAYCSVKGDIDCELPEEGQIVITIKNAKIVKTEENGKITETSIRFDIVSIDEVDEDSDEEEAPKSGKSVEQSIRDLIKDTAKQVMAEED